MQQTETHDRTTPTGRAADFGDPLAGSLAGSRANQADRPGRDARETPQQIVARLNGLLAGGGRPGGFEAVDDHDHDHHDHHGDEDQAADPDHPASAPSMHAGSDREEAVAAVLDRATRARAGRDSGGRRRRRVAAAVSEALRGPAAGAAVEAVSPVSTGWPEVDRTLAIRAGGDPEAPGGLARGRLHEWLDADDGNAEAGRSDPGGGPGAAGRGRPGTDWSPPIAMLAHLADRAVHTAAEADAGGVVAWVGHRVWPAPGFAAARRHLDRSIYIDPPDEASRLWTLDLLVRCPAVTAVVADGTGLTMAATRRLQLAARAGRALVLLARPPWERTALSAAATRWSVAPEPTTDGMPNWTVQLRRCKAAVERGQVAVSVGLAAAAAASGRSAGRTAGGEQDTWRLRWTGDALESVTQEAMHITTAMRTWRHGHDARSGDVIDSGSGSRSGRTQAASGNPWLPAGAGGDARDERGWIGRGTRCAGVGPAA